MYKKSLLLLFSFLLLLTSCADDSQPAESPNAEKETHHETITPDMTSPPDESDPPDEDDTSKTTEPDPDKEEATKDPKKVLNKVLNDLDELDKLFNDEQS